jgi:hypothetical protein
MAIHLKHSRRPAGAALQTSGELLPEGIALELVRDPAGGGLALLRWDGSCLITKPRFEHDRHTYVPLGVNRRLARELFLPPRAARHKQTGQLLAELEIFFNSSFKLVGSGATLLSLLVLASWIPEALPAAACIIVHGSFLEVTGIMRLLCDPAMAQIGKSDVHDVGGE